MSEEKRRGITRKITQYSKDHLNENVNDKKLLVSYEQGYKIDTTEKILIELKKMVEENYFTIELEQEILELINKVRLGEENLFDYRRSDSKDKYGEEIVMAISIAHQQLKKNF